jgi:16S rRNA (guanine527-N7)-methyltransferase
MSADVLSSGAPALADCAGQCHPTISTMPTNDSPDDTLAAALARLGIELPGEHVEQLDRYCRRLWDWNERVNLTRHTDYEKFVRRDVVDAVQIEPFLESGERILDVGTGGGLPGVLLAVIRPDLQVTLCDSVAKKARAVQAIVEEAGLAIPVRHSAAQDLVDSARFDTLVIRAVAPLPKLLTWFKPHWDSFGRLVLIKGPSWVEERAAARERRLFQGLRLAKLATYPLAGTDSESVILEIRPRE